MAESEIVPTAELREVTVIAEGGELPEKLREALLSVEHTTKQLAPLKLRAQKEVKTADDYREIGAVLSETRGLKKQGLGYLSPFEALVERAKTFLKIKRQAHEVACGEIENVCLAKMKTYERAESEAAQREQDALNKQAKKTDSAPVTVKPNIPATSGYRRSTNWRIEVYDKQKFMRAAKERKELREFIILDEPALQAEAKDMKDVKAFEAKYPGIRCHKE